MKGFVTGGNGFIGNRVVRRLHTAGHQVRCLLRASSRDRRLEDLPFERHLGDLREPDTLAAGMQGCQGVIHLASLSAWEQIRSPLMREIVVQGTTNVLRAAQRAGGLRTVFVSSCAAINGTREPVVQDESAAFTLPPEPFVYATAKRDAERICHRHAADGLPVVIVNPCEVYGPHDDDFITASYLRDAIKDWPALAVRGGAAVAHVDDIAAGIVAALEKGRSGERYILGGDNLTARQIIELTLRAAGQQDKRIMQLPNRLTLGLVRLLARLRLPTPVHPDLLAHAVLFWYVDCSKAQKELGYAWRPAEQVLQEVVDWLRETGHL